MLLLEGLELLLPGGLGGLALLMPGLEARRAVLGPQTLLWLAGLAAVTGVAHAAVAGSSSLALLPELEARVQLGWLAEGRKTKRSRSR